MYQKFNFQIYNFKRHLQNHFWQTKASLTKSYKGLSVLKNISKGRHCICDHDREICYGSRIYLVQRLTDGRSNLRTRSGNSEAIRE